MARKRIRRYDASGRQKRARETRDRVLDVARTSFFRHGYGDTTLTAIAEAAGVSAETIYKRFGGKSGLVRAIYERALQGAGPRPAEERSDAMSAAETDPRAIVRAWGKLTAEVAPRVAPFALLVGAAAESEPELASLLRDIDTRRLARMTQNAHVLARRGFLRKGVTVAAAAEIMWTYTAPELYGLLVVRRKWTPARLGAFVAEAMSAALL
jgi:AcrR family transcriptional regulator